MSKDDPGADTSAQNKAVTMFDDYLPIIGPLIADFEVKQALDEVLGEDEELIAMFSANSKFKMAGKGSPKARTVGKDNHVLVTDRQVIIWAQGFLKTEIVEIPFSEINSCEYKEHMMFGEVIMNVNGGMEYLTSMIKDAAKKVVELVQAQMADAAK